SPWLACDFGSPFSSSKDSQIIWFGVIAPNVRTATTTIKDFCHQLFTFITFNFEHFVKLTIVINDFYVERFHLLPIHCTIKRVSTPCFFQKGGIFMDASLLIGLGLLFMLVYLTSLSFTD